MVCTYVDAQVLLGQVTDSSVPGSPMEQTRIRFTQNLGKIRRMHIDMAEIGSEPFLLTRLLEALREDLPV